MYLSGSRGPPPSFECMAFQMKAVFICYKSIKILILSPHVFFQARNAPKPVFVAPPQAPLGWLTTLPRPPSRLGRGTPLPFPSPSIPLASSFRRLRRFASRRLRRLERASLHTGYRHPPFRKFWIRPCEKNGSLTIIRLSRTSVHTNKLFIDSSA